MMRPLHLTVVLMLALSAGPALGQSAGAPNAAAALAATAGVKNLGATSTAASPATQAAGVSVSAADAQNLIATLQNDQARARLITALQALIAAQKAAEPAPAPSSVETAAQGMVEDLAARFDAIGTQMIDLAGIVQAAPKTADWLAAQTASPAARMRWLNILWRLAVVFAVGGFIALALHRLLRPLRARIESRSGGAFVRWLALFVTTLVLNLLPVAVFAAAAALTLAVLHPGVPARPLAVVAIGAIVRSQALLAVAAAALLSPAYFYFLRLGAEARTYLYIWARRFILWTVYGFAVARIAAILGADAAIDDLVLRLTTIVLAGLAIVFVLQNQAAVTAFLRGPPDQERPAGAFRATRAALADTWHILAIVYILGSFGSYLVDLHGGFAFVLRATIASIAVLAGAVVAARLVNRLNARGFELTADMRRRYPGLEKRANRYVPALVFVVSALVYVAAVVLLLQAWGTDIVGWFAFETVRRVLGSLASIVVVIVIAVAIWELTSAAVERAVGGAGAHGAQVSARLRTLLPLLRTTVLIAIVTMAGFVVLSQLGVDIAPLLAGAGIIGIAIGLGSQQLVRDVINGLFILVENTVIVGETVDVGGGHTGVVEEISIRSMRLRDGTGAVHTIPFSSVTAITNSNRGIGNAAVSVSVALGEDTDRAARLLAEIATAMRQDPAFKFQMLSELQYWGIDKVDGSAVTLVGQIVCTDAGRWPVQREFNRRVMQSFQEEGIAYALPTQAVVMHEPERMPGTRPGDPPQVTPLRAPRDRG
jgi:small conductance mechanosensitive channel